MRGVSSGRTRRTSSGAVQLSWSQLSRVSHWEAFLREAILRPAGLTDTDYDTDDDPPAPREGPRDRATGYVPGPDGRLLDAPALHASNAYAAGGLASTVEDLYRWERALAGGDVLGPGSLEAMFRPEQGNYAYGWYVLPAPGGGGRTAGHDESIPGFSAFVWRYFDDDLYLVLLSNVERYPACDTLFGLAQAVLTAAPEEAPPPA